MIRLEPQCRRFAAQHGDIFAPGRMPNGVQRLYKDVLALERDDAARAKVNQHLYKAYSPALMLAPKHFKSWVMGNDKSDGFGSGEVARMNAKYKCMKSLVQDARREVTHLGEQVRKRSHHRVSPAEQCALEALHALVGRMVLEARNDLATLTTRANETAQVCNLLRVEDIDEATGDFRYVPDQLRPKKDKMGIPERDAQGNILPLVPLTLNVRWFGRTHSVTAKNRVQFAGLQEVFYAISGHMFTLRTRHVEPRLGELTVLHRSLHAIVTGEINKADGWPMSALEKHIDEVPQPYVGPVDAVLADPAFGAMVNGTLEPFAYDWDVWKFWAKSEEYWRPELARLEKRVTVYHRRGRGVLLEAEGLFKPGAAPLSKEITDRFSATAGLLITFIETLVADRPVVRAIHARAAEALEKRPQGWVTDIFTTPWRTLHCSDDWSRNGVFDGYQVLHDRTKTLAADMLVTQRMLTNLTKALQKRIKARKWEMRQSLGPTCTAPAQGDVASHKFLKAWGKKEREQLALGTGS